MKTFLAFMLAMCFETALAQSPKHGGIVADVKADGTSAYKAELARAKDTLKIYIFDTNMKPASLKGFDKKGSASLTTKYKGKDKTIYFPVELKGSLFQGPLPATPAKPYSVTVTLKEGGKDLVTTFENLK